MFSLTGLLAAVALAGTGLSTGLLYAFSVAVMRGLNDVDPERAIEVMQRINQRIQNPVFLAGFVGAPIAAFASGMLLLLQDERDAGMILLASAALYVLGVIGPTALVNVPENNRLDEVSLPVKRGEAGAIWERYARRWTRWNHLRTLLGTVSLLLLGLGLYLWGGD